LTDILVDRGDFLRYLNARIPDKLASIEKAWPDNLASDMIGAITNQFAKLAKPVLPIDEHELLFDGSRFNSELVCVCMANHVEMAEIYGLIAQVKKIVLDCIESSKPKALYHHLKSESTEGSQNRMEHKNRHKSRISYPF
jgi:hypothetical protein